MTPFLASAAPSYTATELDPSLKPGTPFREALDHGEAVVDPLNAPAADLVAPREPRRTKCLALTPELQASHDPFVRQFLDGAPDGPIPFDAAARPVAA